MSGQTANSMVSTNSLYKSPLNDGLGGLISGRSNNQDVFDFMQTNYGASPDYFYSLSAQDQADMLSNMQTDGFQGDISMGGDWLGINGLDMNAIVGGGQALMAGLDIYNTFKGMGQQEDLFNAKMDAYATNKRNIQEDRTHDKNVKTNFAKDSRDVLSSVKPKGLGDTKTIG